MVQKKKMIIYISSSIFIVLVITLLFLLTYYQQKELKSFHRKYRQLAIGLSKGEIRAKWGEPEYSIRVWGGQELWSYRNEAHPAHFFDKITFADRITPRKWQRIDQVDSLEELAEISSYSNAELLFDKEGLLEAYTKVGEEIAVHSRYGDIDGSNWRSYARYIGEQSK